MTYEEALEKLIAEGAIREYKLSDNLAFVYRYQNGRFQARGLYGREGDWRLGGRLVSALDYSDASGWHTVNVLPWQARAIEDPAAQKNPGYAIAILQQCYTCKEEKPISAFSHAGPPSLRPRDWECSECYQRRMRELAQFKAQSPKRQGDALNQDTLASPPPPEGEI